MNFQLELAYFANRDHYNALLAEAAQARLLKNLQTEWAPAEGREAPWWQQQIGRAWRWLTQSAANPSAPGQRNGVVRQV